MKKEYVVSAKEMKQYDTNTIEKIGIPSAVLMERAAYAVAMEALDFLKDYKNARVLVLCGNGNNGADGVCTGRILKEYGVNAHICLLKSNHPYTAQVQKQLGIASYYDISVLKEADVQLEQYDLILDAIFGIGLNREITGATRELIEKVNDSEVPVISVDIPSGIDATTGKVLGCAIKADRTVTFGFYKSGQLFYPGRLYCGKLTKAKIAINETGFWGHEPTMFTYLPKEQEETLDSLREPMGNKGTFGKVFVIAGRASTTGAAILCAKSALRSGCGMVAVLTEENNKNALLESLPEAMIETYTDAESEDSLLIKMKKWIGWADTVVIGCGLGRDERACGMVKAAFQECNIPIVCDADALQLIAEKEDLAKELHDFVNRSDQNRNTVVFTPHPRELASLAHCTIGEIKTDRMAVIARVLEEYPVILIAKDADTLVCAKNRESYLNITGNDGLATAGSGDVLAGLTASMIARGSKNGMSTFDAVCKSVFYHGKAADELAKENGRSFLVASDLIEAYKYIMK